MTDLETAARDACHIWRAFSTDANGVCADKPDDVYIEAFLAGAAHMQNKENELTQIIKWRDESIEELRQTIINERKRIEELERELAWQKTLKTFVTLDVAEMNNNNLADDLTKERELLKEARSWMHSDYCSYKCHPFCIKLTAALENK